MYFCNAKNILQSKSGDTHQNFIDTANTPLIGGIIFFFSTLILGIYTLNLFYLFSLVILILGIFSDVKKNISPILRLTFQTLIILIAVYFFENTIGATKIHFLDRLLINEYFSIIFATFCILILINGTNFIDGTNLIVSGYYLILAIILISFENFDYLYFFKIKILYLIIPLFLIFILNSINKIYLGDSGSYLLGFIFGFELINFYNQSEVSPFFIILLLWYPCFEMLFSIFRKLNFNKSPLRPDSKHFHQLLYYFINKKFKNSIISSSLSGLFINIYNLIIFFISITNPTHTQFLIFLLIINLTVYSFLYLRLHKFRFRSTY